VQVLKQTSNILAKQDAGADVNFDVNGMTITHATGLPAGFREQGQLSTTATALLTTPGAGTSHVIGSIKITNTGASTRLVTFYVPEDGSTATAATEWGSDIQLLTLESAEWTGTGWIIYDANGVAKMSVISPIASTQADQESGSNLTTFVSPGRAHFHPSATKFWCDAVGAGTSVNASYNVTSLTDTGPGLLTINIATDFSSANYAITCTVERASTALTVANIRGTEVRNAGQAAGTILVECWDDVATTHGQVDPTSYFVAGWGDL
jgi:hypothetical protein